MAVVKQILDQFTGTMLVDALMDAMAECVEDFAADREKCRRAARDLKQAMGPDPEIPVEQELEAIRTQTVSNFLYAGVLGCMANLDHFRDPVVRNFLEVDSEIYLREATAHRLPAYEKAGTVRDRFYAQLTPRQQELYEDVAAFVSHLETAGPKLAHYYGYLLGNTLLYYVVPGYHSDQTMTARYSRMMEEYFGKKPAD